VPTSTTLAGPVSVGTAPLFGEVIGLDALVVSAGRAYRIDLDAATAVPIPIAFLGGGFVVPISLGVLAVPFDQFAAVLYPYDGSTPRTVATAGPRFVGEGPPGRLWFIDYQGTATGSRLGYVDTASSDALVAVETETRLGGFLPDGISGVLTVAPGGTYRIVPPQSAERISDGAAIAARNGYVVEAMCDGQLRCGYAMLDTTSATRRPLPTPPGAGRDGFGALISPDGQWVAAQSAPSSDAMNGRLTIVGVDGSVADLGVADSVCEGPFCLGAAGWAPDRSVLVGVRGGGTVWMWRPGFTEPRTAPLSVLIGNVQLDPASIVLIPHEATFSSVPVASSGG